MTKVAKGKRKRMYRPKTTTGCFTCKVRRVKCDETRPACLRCISTRRTCDGYSVSLPTAPSSDIHPCDQSRQAFGFFVLHTRHQFAGFFASPFWERMVLQASHHEPAIRHALVAIGSLHQDRIQHRGCANRFALEQYNLSIKILLQPLASHGRQALDVCLICAVLFTYFENMQGHHAEAGCHIQSGAKLLRETVYSSSDGRLRHEVLESQGSESMYVPFVVLIDFFAGLDDSVAAMIRGHKFGTYKDIVSGTQPLAFSNLEEARDMLEHGRYVFKRGNLSHATTDVLQETDCLVSFFKRALNEFISTHRQSFTPKDEIAAAVLQLHALYTHISLPGHSLSAGSDNFLPQMAEMVRLGEQIVKSLGVLDGPSTSFCMGLGFVIPLFSVASGCQDPVIRRQAVSLLRRTSRQEGLWDSQLVAKACERIIAIEESKGVKLMGVCDLQTSSSLLQLDSTGGRLQYVLEDEKLGPITVTEKVFDY